MLNEFHIQVPFWSAWQKFGWRKGEYGVGLAKDIIDRLAEQNKTAIVRIGKDPKAYTIKAKKVQKFPIEQIKNWDKQVYIVKKSALNYKKVEPLTDEVLAKMGVFGAIIFIIFNIFYG
jgi:hypothetical protein